MSKAKFLAAAFATVAKSATVHYVLSESNVTNREQRRHLEREHKRQVAAEKKRAPKDPA